MDWGSLVGNKVRFPRKFLYDFDELTHLHYLNHFDRAVFKTNSQVDYVPTGINLNVDFFWPPEQGLCRRQAVGVGQYSAFRCLVGWVTVDESVLLGCNCAWYSRYLGWVELEHAGVCIGTRRLGLGGKICPFWFDQCCTDQGTFCRWRRLLDDACKCDDAMVHLQSVRSDSH